MLPRYHIIVGSLITPIIHFTFQLTLLQSTIVFLSSFLIDVDHFLIYVIIKKDLSLKRASLYFIQLKEKWIALNPEERINKKYVLFPFHGIEFWIFLLILTPVFPLIWFVLIGFIIHMVPDYIDLAYYKYPLYRKISQIYLYYHNINT